jgi:hypothetical protein
MTTNEPLPDLMTCPFCGAEAEICFVCQSIECPNDKCPISPWTNHVGDLHDEHDRTWIKEAARRWNTRAYVSAAEAGEGNR